MRAYGVFLSSVIVCGLGSVSIADITSRLNIATEDGAVSTWPYKAKFTNGSVTDNGDGTVSITSSGGGNFVSKTGDSISGDLTFTTSAIGPVLVDAVGCTWRITVDTLGVPGSTLLSCPSTGFVLMEDGTYVLIEDGTKIQVE